MLFLTHRRAAVLRGLFLVGASLVCHFARAQQLSAPPQSVLLDQSAPPDPFAVALQDDVPAVFAPDPNDSPALKPSAPSLSARVLPASQIAPPPDDFGQTPAQLEPWLLGLSSVRPAQIKTRILGKSPGGRDIVALEISPPGVSPSKLRHLVVLCRQHGNEPEASAAGARFIREFLTSTDPKKQRIARKMALFIVPIANPDGAAAYRRRTDAKVDMNRDWGRQKSSEVQILTNWIVTSRPNLVVDVHQWLPDESQPPPMAEASGGILARQTAHRMAQNSAAHGFWLAARSRWGLDTLCHRYFGQRFKIPAILLESRHRPRVPGARDVAIGTSLAALWSAAETVSK